MDKNAIKKYAVWARNELIAKVSQKATAYGIGKDNIVEANADSINGVMLSSIERKQRKALIEQVNEKGYEQVIEEVAYTWFNRFTAIRFMEVNGYLPSHIRVFTDDDNNFKPQILTEAIHLNDVFEKINMEKVLELKQEDKTEELYKYLLIIQCNSLNTVLPRMFQKIEDYSELLLPDYLLREGSVLEQLVSLIPEEDWKDQVQIIGWLYQYYNSEPKDAVFAALKKNVKISKEKIPAATQLFTPDWIVRYMVENSLGRLWLEGHPNEELKSEWKYYLDEVEQEEDVQKQLDEIKKEYAQLKPEDIKCIDPCMGSGHILCYMFDVLINIYVDYGYTARDAVSSIVEKNIWGLDIDERAAQLSYFAVMMKARQYDRRFLTRGLQPHVYVIEESNEISSAPLYNLGTNLSKEDYDRAIKEIMRLIEEMRDAKEYGSAIDVSPCDWTLLRKFAVPRQSKDGQLTLDIHGEINVSERLQKLIYIGQALSQKYHVVVTNPPYMGSSGMSNKLSDFVKKNYPDNKSDLFSVFIEKCGRMPYLGGFQAMITQHSWMFLASFEKLRLSLNNVNIINMAHLGPHAFEEISGEVVQTTSFVLRQLNVPCYKGNYVRLTEINSQSGKEETFLKGTNRYIVSQKEFQKIPNSPIAYWVNEATFDTFQNSKSIKDYADAKVGLQTGDNNRFLRLWHEVDFSRIYFNASSDKEAMCSGKKWFPYNKGGTYRKWYGNNDYVVNWENNGYEIKHFVDDKGKLRSRPQNTQYYFKEAITWSYITSSSFSARIKRPGFIFDVSGVSLFIEDNYLRSYVLAIMCSKVASYLTKVINPTINLQVGDIQKIPVIEDSELYEEINNLVNQCINASKEDWDSYEISWDFQKNPLIQDVKRIQDAFDVWGKMCEVRFNIIKSNEERINSIFLEKYYLDNTLSKELEDKNVSVSLSDFTRDIKNFISYAVGCMFGRYSLDKSGLVYAGGDWNSSSYSSFLPDKDAIIPICDDEYFKDDIVGRFVEFVEIVYGKEMLEENLQFIAQAIGGKGTSREVIRNYFINGFYADHIKMYQKRPIYWLFDSGKKNGFKCLIYLHRYQPDTIARIRTDYVHEQQSRYRTSIKDLEIRMEKASTSERANLNKKLISLKAQDEELRIYEEKIHHLADQMIEIDLDDGVKINYAKFQDVLAKIK